MAVPYDVGCPEIFWRSVMSRHVSLFELRKCFVQWQPEPDE